MSSTDWSYGAPPNLGPSKQEDAFTMISTTVDDLSYTPTEEQKTRDAEQLLVTGRRSYKTLRGKAEAVWPPALEAALLEALELYHPDKVGSRSARTAGRFPMRNRFISDYIFETTHKRRTPKQVGSRLQQLRDTCKKEKILKLISHRGTPEPMSTSSQSESSPDVSPSPPPPTPSPNPSALQTSIYVKILLQTELWPAPTPCVDLANRNSALPQTIQLAPLASPPSQPSARLLRGKTSSAVLPFLSGYVHLPSPSPLLPHSRFMVYLAGSTVPIHEEISRLQCVSSPIQRTGWIYSSELVPGFWNKLGADHDLGQYTIVQFLRTLNSRQSSGPHSNCDISIVYKFSAAINCASDLRRKTPNERIYSSTFAICDRPATSLLTSNASIMPPQNPRPDDNWRPAKSEDLGIDDIQQLASYYNVEPSFRMAFSSEDPVSSAFASPQQRCGVPLTRISAKYDTHGAYAQPEFGSYYHPSPNANYCTDLSDEAFYPQSYGYAYS